jgi:predicted amidophosphoribosyltransferase
VKLHPKIIYLIDYFLVPILQLFGENQCLICKNENKYTYLSSINNYKSAKHIQTDQILSQNQYFRLRICSKCILDIEKMISNFNRCKVCSYPLNKEERCSKFHHSSFVSNYSLLPLQENLYNLYLEAKYKKNSIALNFFLNLVKIHFIYRKEILKNENSLKNNDYFINSIDDNIDIVTFVPISLQKKYVRKYNPSQKFAQIISKQLSKPLIKCFKETGFSYRHIDRDKSNATEFADRFSILQKSKEIIENKKILLVDDIYTTGKTVAYLSDLLSLCGSNKVYIFTLFRNT